MLEVIRFIQAEWVNLLVFLFYIVTLFGSEFLRQRFEDQQNRRPENSAQERKK